MKKATWVTERVVTDHFSIVVY